MNERTRAWIYRVLPVVIAALLSFGIVTEDQATQISGLIVALLGPILAAFNTSTEKLPPPPPPQ